MRLNDPEVVRQEYASEERLAARSRAWREWIEGPNAEHVALEAVREVSPRRVLEAGCGPGEYAARLAGELGAEVVAVDLSPRMVELARARGVDARVGDVQALPFPDGSFDCVVANWMLYHLPELDCGLAELARVLRPGGRLVAATFSEENLGNLWELLGAEARRPHQFSKENGGEALRRRFARVEARPVETTVVFPDREAVKAYVAASMTRSHLADRVPEFEGPFRARGAHVVFVAENPVIGSAR